MHCRLTEGGFPDPIELPAREYSGTFVTHFVEPSGIPRKRQYVYYEIDGVIFGPETPDKTIPEVPGANYLQIQGKGILEIVSRR